MFMKLDNGKVGFRLHCVLCVVCVYVCVCVCV